MAQTNVSSCVLSIIASFTSGVDVFKKFRESQKRTEGRRKKSGVDEEEEVRLTRSLRMGSKEIGREYQRSVYAAGEHFAQGDGIAQTSLAEILLKLNTGFVTIINTFLTKDKQVARLDYQSLTSLSERSRDDTCRTLRHLFRRLTQRRVPDSLPLSERPHQKRERPSDGSAISSKSRESGSGQKPTRVRRPMLARVVIAD
ncbi:hypothetical protein DOTSEDRAFT_75004 [Dothistroma septosporum NZE10]|uniref:Uncharacterized protein n=1 Tax=Dothistroma septosporum (strain NZE10 / CBS 128990) TaxID=675120 RepID=N1PCU6_DOTSN|nr:hypothetical protein DOTSEDRAFT_75004 [Dothistroma septosporum NZE10]